MKITLFKIACVTFLACLASCSSQKKVPYVLDAENLPSEVLGQIATVNDPVLAPGDLLNISVISQDMASAAPFNKGMYINNNGDVSRLAGGFTSMTNNNYEILTEYYLINSDGKITFPILGNIQAGGLTKKQLAEEIVNAIYPKYIKDRPSVEVRLMNFRVFVTGAVRNPGMVRSGNERMNFFEAVTLAGDLDIRGDRENILIIRVNPDGSREVHKVNIHDRNFLTSPYFNLQQNDIIYVQPNKSLAQSAWTLNPAVAAVLTYVGGLSSLGSLIIGIVNLSK